MKKQNLTKFALSIVCAAVLSACGGSSSSTDTSAADAEKAKQEAEAKAKADKIATLTQAAKAAGLTDEQAAQFAAVDANLALDTSSDAFKAAITAFKASLTPTTASSVGYKIVVKDNSDLNVDAEGTTIQGAYQAMGQQNPQVRLDHIVVAEDRKSTQATAIYLEDFDLTTGTDKASALVGNDIGAKVNGNLAKAEDVAKYGYIQLRSIHAAGKDLDSAKTTNDAGASRTGHYSEKLIAQGGSGKGTRIEKAGSEAGVVLTYHEGRRDYTENATYADATLKTALTNTASKAQALQKIDGSQDTDRLTDENFSVYTDGKTVGKETNFRRGATVAEVYGFRSFAKGDANLTDTFNKDHDMPNLPLTGNLSKHQAGQDQTYAGTQLKHVQYGRVTTALNGMTLENLKEGRLENGYKTYLGSYGYYGNTGTEDHYFFRGIDNITEAQLTELKKANAGKKLSYEGHAVAYGLDDKYKPENVSGLATAFGTGTYTLFSGNHVKATYNIDDSTVEGSIFNRYIKDNTVDFNAKGNKAEQDLVKFSGEVSTKGDIKGTAALTYGDKSEGTFNATFFGSKAEELGGLVASKAGTAADKAWGASFGAIQTTKTESSLGQASDKAKTTP